MGSAECVTGCGDWAIEPSNGGDYPKIGRTTKVLVFCVKKTYGRVSLERVMRITDEERCCFRRRCADLRVCPGMVWLKRHVKEGVRCTALYG